MQGYLLKMQLQPFIANYNITYCSVQDSVCMPSIHSQYTCMLQYLVPRHSNRTVLQRTSTWCMHDQCRNHCTCSAFVEWSFNAGAYRSMVWPDPYFVPSLARSTDWADNPRIVAQSADPCFAQRNPRIVTDPWFAHNIYIIYMHSDTSHSTSFAK